MKMVYCDEVILGKGGWGARGESSREDRWAGTRGEAPAVGM